MTFEYVSAVLFVSPKLLSDIWIQEDVILD